MYRLWCRSVSILALLTVCLLGAYGQDDPRNSLSSPAQTQIELPKGIDMTELNKTSAEILKVRPNIPESVLREDLQIITANFGDIRSEFGKIGRRTKTLFGRLKGHGKLLALNHR